MAAATIERFGFEGAADETTVSVSTNAAEDTALDTVTIGGTSSLRHDTAQAMRGTRSARLNGAAAAVTHMAWILSAGITTAYARFYVRLPAAPTATFNIWRAIDGAAAQIARVTLGASQILGATDAANGNLGQMTTVLNLNTWYRVEVKVVSHATAGVLEIKLFIGHSETATETLTFTNINTRGGDIERFLFGQTVSTAGSPGDLWLDDLGIATAGYAGPSLQTVSPTGIGTSEAFGTPKLVAQIRPAGFAPEEGAPLVLARSSVAHKKDGSQVALGAPRYETGQFGQGVMVEEGTTNLIHYSDEFDNAWWPKSNASVTADAATAPDGTATADKLVEDTANAIHMLNKAGVLTVGSVGAFEVIAKAGERSFAVLNVGNASTWFDLSTGAIGAIGSGHTALMVALGSGWYLCSVAMASVPTTGNVQIRIAQVNGSSTYTGDGASGIYIWRAQAELKAYATSPMQTSGGTATRAVESLSVPASSLSPTEGTVELSLDVNEILRTASISPRLFRVAGSIGGEIRITINPAGGSIVLTTADDTGAATSGTWSTTLSLGWRRFAITWTSTTAVLYVDGVARATISNPKLPSAFAADAFIGSASAGAQPVDSLVDEVRFSNRSRSAGEILAAYNAGVALAVDASAMMKASLDSTLTTSKSLFGHPRLIAQIRPSSISSGETFGLPRFISQIRPSSIVSAEGFGTPDVRHTDNVYPSSIPSAEGFGSPTLTPGAVVITPVGIASGESFGVPRLVAQVRVVSIASAEAFGTPKLTAIIRPVGIASGQAFGIPVLIPAGVTIFPVGIASAAAFGVPILIKGVPVGYVAIPTQPLYRVVVADLNGVPIDEVPTKNLQYSFVLNDAGTCSFNLDIQHSKAIRSLLDPGKREIHVWREGVMKWGGYLWFVGATTGDSTIRVSADGWYSRLYRRHIDEKKTYVDVDQFDIAWDLINWTQLKTDGALGITRFSSALSGKVRTRKYKTWERVKIADAIADMAEAKDGFDFEITPTKQWKTYYPTKGSVSTIIFELGRNIGNISYDIDATSTVSELTGLGAGTDRDRCMTVVTNVAAAADFKLLQDSIDFSNVKHYDSLVDKTKEQLRLRKKARWQPQISVETDNPQLDIINLGDVVTVKADYGYIEVDDAFKIIASVVHLSEEGKEKTEVFFDQQLAVEP